MFDFRAILRALAHHDVDFAIVGGLAGVLHGAPIHTQDLDILYSLTSPNPERLLAATTELGAVFFGDARNLPKLTRPKDQLALLQLEATLAERSKP